MLHSLLLLVIGLVCMPLAVADTIYKYRDADGQWWFTDKKPKGKTYDRIEYNYDGSQKHRSEQPGSTDPRVRVVEQGAGASRQLVAINPFLAPVQIRVTPKNFAMAETDVVIPAKTTQKLYQPGTSAPQLKFTYRWQLGDPRAVPTPFLYLPPVELGKGFPVSQAFNGRFSHFRENNRYAIDVAMPVGTAIRAARGGLVIEAEERHTEASKSGWNYVRVLHEDGTIAVYGHLKHRGLLVREGDRVQMGQLIASSGNTGFSTGPHLHFVLQRNAGMKTLSIPFEFRNQRGQPFTPAAGQLLASH